jgi:hypothetical protein
MCTRQNTFVTGHSAYRDTEVKLHALQSSAIDKGVGSGLCSDRLNPCEPGRALEPVWTWWEVPSPAVNPYSVGAILAPS